jgi:hypothetical protein
VFRFALIAFVACSHPAPPPGNVAASGDYFGEWSDGRQRLELQPEHAFLESYAPCTAQNAGCVAGSIARGTWNDAKHVVAFDKGPIDVHRDGNFVTLTVDGAPLRLERQPTAKQLGGERWRGEGRELALNADGTYELARPEHERDRGTWKLESGTLSIKSSNPEGGAEDWTIWFEHGIEVLHADAVEQWAMQRVR